MAMIATESMSMSNSNLYFAGRDQHNIYNYVSGDSRSGPRLDESKFIGIVAFWSNRISVLIGINRSLGYLTLALSAQL
jgi:hypothetical protein